MMTTDEAGSSSSGNDTQREQFDECCRGQLDEYHRGQLDERTEAVLGVLRDRTEPITLAKLAAEVVEAGFRTSTSAHAVAECVEDVEVRLHHADLPRLNELGVVAYDPDRHLVCPPPSLDGNWPSR